MTSQILELKFQANFLISFALALNVRLHGISNPPCGKSAEYRLLPDTVQHIEPPLLRNREQIFEILLGKCPIIVLFLTTATAYLSTAFVGSLSHNNSSPMAAVHMAW